MTASIRSSATLTRDLPNSPNLEHLRNQAKARLKALRAVDPTAKLAEAQLEVARSYGYRSWRQLHAELIKSTQMPELESDADKVERLRIDQARQRKEMKVNHDILKKYVGYYELNERQIFTIQIDDGELIARLTGQMFLSLVPESRVKFFYRNSRIQAQITFISDDTGKVNALILHQHGLEQISRRVGQDRLDAVERPRTDHRLSNKPWPGSQSALERMIEATRKGNTDCGFMTDALERVYKEQLRDNMRTIRGWGGLTKVEFKGVSSVDDCDVYEVDFAGAQTEWRIILDGAGRIESASFRILP
ncbi:DUF3471 domain-containing protein [Methylobacterium sp. E-016]|uniref:DUF3471 domain-containing protein n=1 Tax=Methylobacterium sp. E-016 TaxID=2836556 RepID=UPI001FBAEEE5|nr:DUF3471 domain-containing protein [Methylobacterium sp. E-016]MCJ2074743.1 DUF3471 domain-containing protein [Methylobacterium sp. E-016]